MKKVLALAGLLLMLGCSPDSKSTAEGPGGEATSQTSPAQEVTTPPSDGVASTDSGGGDNQEVSVDLPGLPIGGSGAVFSHDAPTACVDVNVTGFTLPDGVGIKFTKMRVPPQFTVDSTPCSDAPCVGGSHRVTAETGGCAVSVTWNGEPVDAEASDLRADAKAFCKSQTACAQVKAAADAANEQTGGQFAVGLTVDPSADGASTPVDGASTPVDGASTPADGASTPADGASTPADGASTPAGGASEGSSPSAGSSGG